MQKIIDFIQNTYQTKEFIPLHEPRFVGNEKKYLNECIDSTFVSSVGKYVDQFEQEFAKYVGTKYAIATVNGTAALHISLLLADVKSQDEVLTQPLTFIATCNAITYCGASPIFIDVDRETMGMSPKALQKCHGAKGEESAYGVSRVLNTMSEEDMKHAIRDYDLNDVASTTAILMKPFASMLMDHDVENIHSYLQSIK